MSAACMAERILAANLIADAKSCGTYWLGEHSGKILLASIPGVDLADPECRAMLNSLRRLGLIQMSRCDMPAACPKDQRDLLNRSEFSDRGCDVHFLLVD